ncbi:MAG: hypothetical protein ACKO3N_19435, partial [Verrucomicrobiota bacterium]
GLFFATLRGPGRVWLQSLPFSRLADRIYSASPKAGGNRVGEGSILGGLGGLLDGDNELAACQVLGHRLRPRGAVAKRNAGASRNRAVTEDPRSHRSLSAPPFGRLSSWARAAWLAPHSHAGFAR